MKNLTPVTREEKYLHAIATQEPADITPVTGEEKFLAALASGEAPNREPKTRKEYFLSECANGTGGGSYIKVLENDNAVFEYSSDDYAAVVTNNPGSFTPEVHKLYKLTIDDNVNYGFANLLDPIGTNPLSMMLFENIPVGSNTLSSGVSADGKIQVYGNEADAYTEFCASTHKVTVEAMEY